MEDDPRVPELGKNEHEMEQELTTKGDEMKLGTQPSRDSSLEGPPDTGISSAPPRALPDEVPSSIAKRMLDTALATVALLLSLPIWLLIAIVIKLDSRGPVFYRQARYGKGGRHFTLYKFRTMAADSDAQYGILAALENDERITRIGRVLRATGADEIPQFLNILLGDMSFVGPRALAVGEIAHSEGERGGIQNTPDFERRLLVPPGLTGLATIYLPKDASPTQKLEYDLRYIEERTFLGDIGLIFLSLWISIRGKWETRQNKY